MHVEQIHWRVSDGWQNVSSSARDADLVFYFGCRDAIASAERFRELRTLYPDAKIVGCSTGGQIRGDDVNDDEVCGAVVKFETTRVRVFAQEITGSDQSHACGEALGAMLVDKDLAGAFILSDGLNVNGSLLVSGISKHVDPRVPLSGGLAGDGEQFNTTLISANAEPRSHTVAAIGFYGPDARIGLGVSGGWDVFGPRRKVTRSSGNVLFELDGKPALELYERYLGEDDAKGLPGTGILFPIQLSDPARPDHKIVRTILAIDRETGSMTFAGDVPEGWTAQLMRGDFDRLEAGAGEAARLSVTSNDVQDNRDSLALLVSCVGRRWLLGQRIVNELEAAGAELGARTARIGFYSYGEIAPHPVSGARELHNQTMTVTTISEARH